MTFAALDVREMQLFRGERAHPDGEDDGSDAMPHLIGAQAGVAIWMLMGTRPLCHCATLLRRPVADGTGPTLRGSLARYAFYVPRGPPLLLCEGSQEVRPSPRSVRRCRRYQGLQTRPSGVRGISMPGSLGRTCNPPHCRLQGKGRHHPWLFCSTVVEISHHRVNDRRQAAGTLPQPLSSALDAGVFAACIDAYRRHGRGQHSSHVREGRAPCEAALPRYPRALRCLAR